MTGAPRLAATLARLRRGRLVQKLRYELLYAWPGWDADALFNPGFLPLDPDVAAAAAPDPNQVQLYAELLKTAEGGPEALAGGRLLEVAAGRGGGLRFMARRLRPSRAAGLDVSAAAARAGRRRGLDLRAGPAHRLPFPDGAFDVVVALDALIHMAERDAAVREIARALAPGGRFLTGDFMLGSFAGAQAHLDAVATLGGFAPRRIRDVTDGVLRSLEADRDRKAALLARAPRLLRAGLAETMALPGTRRYEEWRSGRRVYYMADLAKR